MLIESWPGLTVVGEAGNTVDAQEISAREKPGILLLNLELSQGGDGLDCISDLFSTSGKGRLIILTGVRDPEVQNSSPSKTPQPNPLRVGADRLSVQVQGVRIVF
jgi:DNA-binding NarL/FixJ family response regulator